MRRLIYALVVVGVMAAAGGRAPLARASDGSSSGPQVEFGAVRANTGTLYAVQSSGGASSVSEIETAGWNTCTSGYSPVGYDFDQNGFWLCARSDLAGQRFYVGNVVNDTGYWWEVQGGSATGEGDEGWNYCPSSATLLGTQFTSNGFWVCYVPPAPAPAPAPPAASSGGGTTSVVPSPSAVPPSPAKTQLGHVHVRIVLRWTWKGAQTSLMGLRFVRLPRDAAVIITCRGRGCPQRSVRATAQHLRQLRRRVVDRRYHRGDRITITVTAPGALPELASIVIRDGRMPHAALLAP